MDVPLSLLLQQWDTAHTPYFVSNAVWDTLSFITILPAGRAAAAAAAVLYMWTMLHCFLLRCSFRFFPFFSSRILTQVLVEFLPESFVWYQSIVFTRWYRFLLPSVVCQVM
jgi:hypothetical protein